MEIVDFNKREKVFIRADGSSKIGLGHLVRCMALAHMVKNDFTIYFYVKEIPEKIFVEITRAGFIVRKINKEEEIFNDLTGKEIVVVDHYELGTEYQKEIKQIGCKLVCIDDLHEKEFVADLIINHAPGITPADYQAQSYTQFALGLDFALLRPAFLEAAREKKTKDNKKSILVCFGGSDILDLTRNVLETVVEEDSFETINVIVGSSYLHFKELEKYISEYKRINLYRGVDEGEMVRVMQDSDVAIVPASGILLEALSLGLTVISGMYVRNQKKFFENYKTTSAFISATNFKKKDVLSALRKLKNKNLSNIPVKIDGKSGKRVLSFFKKLEIEEKIVLRRANIEDINITYKWVSDPKIRAYSFTKGDIPLKEHSEWFLNKLKNKNCLYFIADKDGVAIGSIRFDIKDKEAVISYLVDTNYQGSGLGIIILKKAFELLKGNKLGFEKVVGYVMPNNIPSIKAFRRLGYSCINPLENHKYKFAKKIN